MVDNGDLRLAGTCTLDKSSFVRLSYQYRKLTSTEWAYDTYTTSAPGVSAIELHRPGMTSPNHTVQVVGVSCLYQFR